MIYSQFALFMLRVFNMAHRVALTPQPPLIDYSNNDNQFDTVFGIDENVRVLIDESRDRNFLTTSSSAYLGASIHPATNTGGVGGVGVESRTRMRRIKGDVQIGALFSIHRKKKGSESCGEIWEQYGMHRTEVALKTIEEINNDTSILPNVRLGIDIRDDCWTERTAMEETIEFIRESIGAGPSPTAAAAAGSSSSSTTCAGGVDGGTNKTSNHDDNNLLLAAVVGPGNSDMSIATHNLLQVFRIPQVGYSATTADLSDKSDFKYYMRLVPSDSYQAQALVDIAIHFKWTYIAVIYSNGNYGEKGFEQMQFYIERAANLCVAYTEKIDSLAPAQRFDELLASLYKLKPRPRVAICFCEGDTIRRIFEAVKRHRSTLYGRNGTEFGIQWIGSESWSDRRDVVQGYEDVAAGGISLRIYSPRVPSFDRHYLKLKPSTNSHNPWFVDFWEERFNCSLVEKTATTYSRKCTGREELTGGYVPDPKISQVINSIYTVAYGLDAMYRNVCLGYTGRGLCPAMRVINGQQLLDHMLNVRFNDSLGQEIYFDRNGDPPARYDILSFQGTGYVRAGEWRSIISMNENGTLTYKQNLTVLADKWLWYDGTYAKDNIIESVCSVTCLRGYVKKIQATLPCCWTCIRCLDNEYVADEVTCRNCSLGDWPTENRSACYKLEVEYLRSSSPEAIVVMVLSCIGCLATIYTTAIFARFNSTPVVKATTRELSYIILVGFFLCYFTTFIIVIQPNTATCYMLRILPGLAFAMIYGALLTKTNRIARILAGSKKRILTKKPRFLSTRAQVVITWLLVSIELVMITAILIYEPAKADYDYSFPKRVLLVCQASTLSFLAPFGFDFFLITLCTAYAVKTRNLPENFNEAKFIGFTMYATCIIWLAFITIYFGSNNKGITMCLSFTLSASVALVLLFFPKLYIILFQPHKNVRSSYATTKVIRCHFGTSQSSTLSHSPHDSHRYNPRTFSSGPKTTSTSRPSSSKISARSEIMISESGSRKKKSSFLRDSVHVAIPQTGGAAGVSGQQGGVSLAKDAPAAGDDASTSGAPSRPFRSAVYFQNELSVIEESMMSHDDSLQSQSHLPSSGQSSNEQAQPPAPQSQQPPQPVRSSSWSQKHESCQTDPDLFEDYVRDWIQAKQQHDADAEPARKRSASLHGRVPSMRRRSDLGIGEADPSMEGEESEERHYEFKRTLTEYRKGSKRIRRSDGSRMRIPRRSIVQESMVEDGTTEQLAALITRSRQSLNETRIEEDDDDTVATELPILMRVHALAPIEAVISSQVEEYKRKNTLRRRRRNTSIPGPSLLGRADIQIPETADESEEPLEPPPKPRQQRSISASTPFGDIMAHTFGGAFQTFMGAAVPVDEKEDFYITTDVIEEVDEETELNQKSPQDQHPQISKVQTIETYDLYRGSGSGDQEPSPGGSSSNGGLSTGAVKGSVSPRIERKGSLLSRLGQSIRKKLRRLSGDAAAEAFETQFAHIRQKSSASRQSSIGEPSVAALADDLTSSGLMELPEHSMVTEYSPFGSPVRRSHQYHQQSHPAQQHPRRTRYSSYRARGESADTDSGIGRQLDKTISVDVDEDTDSSKRSSSMKSKKNSYKRSMTVSTLNASPSITIANPSAIPSVAVLSGESTSIGGNIIVTPAEVIGAISVDAGFVDSQTAVNELETLLQSQGLEPVEFTRSTLV